MATIIRAYSKKEPIPLCSFVYPSTFYKPDGSIKTLSLHKKAWIEFQVENSSHETNRLEQKKTVKFIMRNALPGAKVGSKSQITV